jgi:hypothetical protein
MVVKASIFAPCQNCACSLLRRVSRAVTQHYEAAFRGTGLRSTQFTLLATLIQTGPLPIGTLAARPCHAQSLAQASARHRVLSPVQALIRIA